MKWIMYIGYPSLHLIYVNTKSLLISHESTKVIYHRMSHFIIPLLEGPYMKGIERLDDVIALSSYYIYYFS